MSLFKALENQVVLVTGGFQGIGRQVVTTFQNEQAIVIAADLSYSNTSLEQVNDQEYQIKLDVSDEPSVQNLAEQLKIHDLIPNVLVNVAGISTMNYLIESRTTDFDKTLAVNTRGTYLITKYIVQLMVAANRPGKVVLIASQAGKNGYRAMSAYVASKHAVLGLTKTLAIEVAKNQINVNAVCPGIIETSMKHRERKDGAKIRGLTPDEIEAEDNSQVPLGRTGTPQDVANVVLFLASPLSDYMTGQGINVTGGMTMN
ncbi:SDR family oxidoreductase [Companilactobacillus nantensis]|uniref:Short-chain dehydrogenase reductase sdr n=1 Tax=Companilactobacillus nantensis DSM 16982 TaxID=1423774 RepID=A0A0R1WU64_9LACO|nr:SDR family NAD(P)-dependent oxidoreductase [Companilactobacillus nantensis]KRM17948.1 short-chain dehydrogenase reductase sdr [Companilactobacillus nantensis DSM 16982]GEO63611.1 3-ketoacyl-ACP reductase [Companilactobacillus nantensis]